MPQYTPEQPRPPAPAVSTTDVDGPPLRVFVSAAEASGDRHAAELIHEIRRLRPQTSFVGVAGPAMQAAGCEVVDDFTQRATMLVGAIRLAGHAWRLVRRVGRLAREQSFDLAILVDSPALHLPMSKHLKRAGCPILYYVAPQLWAWAPWRIGRFRWRIDQLACILPFEEAYFRQRGVPTRFVGHPLVSQLANQPTDAALASKLAALGEPVVACLPGSRRHVIDEVLPGQIEVIQAIRAKHPETIALLAAATPEAAEQIRAILARELNQRDDKAIPGFRVEVNHNAEILAAADVALCASGTATLEVACRSVPMVVMYNGSKWGYRLVGRWLIRTPHLCLVNILVGRRIVPEFMPYYTSTTPIAIEALDLLANDTRRCTMRADLAQVVRSLGTAHAARSTAAMAVAMAEAGIADHAT